MREKTKVDFSSLVRTNAVMKEAKIFAAVQQNFRNICQPSKVDSFRSKEAHSLFFACIKSEYSFIYINVVGILSLFRWSLERRIICRFRFCTQLTGKECDMRKEGSMTRKGLVELRFASPRSIPALEMDGWMVNVRIKL